MTRQILLFGAGKSATTLIRYLLAECVANNWQLIVADADINLAQSKVGVLPFAKAQQVQVEDQQQRADLITESDLVISLLPPSLHFLIATDCLAYGRHLLTASYMDDNMKSLAADIKHNGLLFLCEMGLDPGIDHMSAMRLIHQIKKDGGEISSFKSHCGGLVAPASDDNPWHYKISWNPGNVVRAGASGAVFREDNVVRSVPYQEIFAGCRTVGINNNELAWYPNRDSLPYSSLYGLDTATTFIRTTLRHPDYCRAWNYIVNAGLTSDESVPADQRRTYKDWSGQLTKYVDHNNKYQFDFLGLFSIDPVPGHLTTSAQILQSCLEEKLMMQPADRDMVVMLHELEYTLANASYKTTSLLMIEGEDNVNTAMAKTVGLPLGIAASLVLKNKISLTGLHIPVIPEIYEPVMEELEVFGINFEETEQRL